MPMWREAGQAERNSRSYARGQAVRYSEAGMLKCLVEVLSGSGKGSDSMSVQGEGKAQS